MVALDMIFCAKPQMANCRLPASQLLQPEPRLSRSHAFAAGFLSSLLRLLLPFVVVVFLRLKVVSLLRGDFDIPSLPRLDIILLPAITIQRPAIDYSTVSIDRIPDIGTFLN